MRSVRRIVLRKLHLWSFMNSFSLMLCLIRVSVVFFVIINHFVIYSTHDKFLKM